jgi:two-component system LytT family response regulator
MELTALVVDDEPFARVLLRTQLEAQRITVIGEAGEAAEALNLAEDLHPDLIFLDIQMPGMTGMQMADVVLHLDKPPFVIFVTGYSEYAISAFERCAFDYLLKPVSPERLAQTLVRVRGRIHDSVARAAVSGAVNAEALSDTTPLRKLPIRDTFSVKFIPVEDIIFAEAREKRVYINTNSTEFRTYYTLKQLETILPSNAFYRTHDSFIVNTTMIEELIFLGSQTYEVRLLNQKCLPVSRNRYSDLQRRLGID